MKTKLNRLRVTDATGKELTARMEVASGILPDVEGAHPAVRNLAVDCSAASLQHTLESAGLEAPALRQAGMPAATMLAVLVSDADAVIPCALTQASATLTGSAWAAFLARTASPSAGRRRERSSRPRSPSSTAWFRLSGATTIRRCSSAPPRAARGTAGPGAGTPPRTRPASPC